MPVKRVVHLQALTHVSYRAEIHHAQVFVTL
jgi:hypothetical protein